MYSPRQRDLRERRIHQQTDEHRFGDEVQAADADESGEFDAPGPWGLHLSARAGAA